MRKGFLIYEEMRKYFPIYEEVVSQIWLCNCFTLNFLIYEEIFFLSVYPLPLVRDKEFGLCMYMFKTWTIVLRQDWCFFTSSVYAVNYLSCTDPCAMNDISFSLSLSVSLLDSPSIHLPHGTPITYGATQLVKVPGPWRHAERTRIGSVL